MKEKFLFQKIFLKARPHIHNEQFLQVLVQECVNTGRYVPPLVQRIKENQNAKTPVEHFKAVGKNFSLNSEKLNIF